MIGKIAKGFVNSVTGKNDDLYLRRSEICDKCPICYDDFLLGKVCSNKLYLNKNGEISKEPKDGYVRGCGCIINLKARLQDEHCIMNKW